MASQPGDCYVPLPSRNSTLLLLTTVTLGLAVSTTIRAAGIARSAPLATLLPELRALSVATMVFGVMLSLLAGVALVWIRQRNRRFFVFYTVAGTLLASALVGLCTETRLKASAASIRANEFSRWKFGWLKLVDKALQQSARAPPSGDEMSLLNALQQDAANPGCGANGVTTWDACSGAVVTWVVNSFSVEVDDCFACSIAALVAIVLCCATSFRMQARPHTVEAKGGAGSHGSSQSNQQQVMLATGDFMPAAIGDV